MELHLAARDWYSHGHHADASYNGVVLHVVVSGSSRLDTVQQSGITAPVAEFPVTDTAEFMVLPTQSLLNAPNVETEKTGDFLDALGDQRFMARSHGFSLELSAGENPDQVIYRALMEALGYRSNQKPFLRLAGLVPYSTFRRYRDDPCITRVAVIEALLLSASGLLPGLEAGPRKTQLERLSRRSRRSKKLRIDEWKLFRVRPNNHPTLRMSGFARVLAKSTTTGLSSVFETAMLQRESTGVLEMLDERPLIGRGRAHEMVVNVVLPYLCSLGAIRDDGRLMTICLANYRSLKALPSYGSTMRFARSVGIPIDRQFIRTARRQQGLLHLQKHFADYADRFDVHHGIM